MPVAEDVIESKNYRVDIPGNLGWVIRATRRLERYILRQINNLT